MPESADLTDQRRHEGVHVFPILFALLVAIREERERRVKFLHLANGECALQRGGSVYLYGPSVEHLQKPSSESREEGFRKSAACVP